MTLISQWLPSSPTFRRVLLLGYCLPLAIGVAGCGGGQEVPKVFSNLVATSGTVTLDGAPLKGAAVMFTPVGQNAVRPAYGLTDDAGKYELITPVHDRTADQNKGAVPGQYQVMISKLVMPNGAEIPKDQSQSDAMRLGARESLPAIYSNPERTKLKAEVVATDKPPKPVKIDFDLKSK